MVKNQINHHLYLINLQKTDSFFKESRKHHFDICNYPANGLSFQMLLSAYVATVPPELSYLKVDPSISFCSVSVKDFEVKEET